MDMLNANVDMTLINQNKYKKIDNKNMNKDELRGACDNFESFFMQQLLDISLKDTNIAGGGTGDEIIKGMYTESLSKASAGSLGISDMLYKFLSDKR